MFSGRRQPSRDGTSRMTRECHVRICERLGVKFPGPTRQSLPKSVARATSAFTPKAAGAPDVAARSGGTGLATSVKRMGEAGAARAIYATVDIVALRARGLVLGGYHG
jgi:hypothetical protein